MQLDLALDLAPDTKKSLSGLSEQAGHGNFKKQSKRSLDHVPKTAILHIRKVMGIKKCLARPKST